METESTTAPPLEPAAAPVAADAASGTAASPLPSQAPAETTTQPAVKKEITDAEITKQLQVILKGAQLEQLTKRMVMDQLAAHFGPAVQEKKPFVTEKLKQLLAAQAEAAEPENREPDRLKNAAGTGRTFDSAKSKPKASVTVKKEEASAAKSRGGFAMPVRISQTLADFMGLSHVVEPKVPRTQAAKFICTYVKDHKLQDPSNRRNIICDEPLKNLLEQDVVTFFSLNKYLAKHFEKGSTSRPAAASSRGSGTTKAKKPSSRKSGFNALMITSPALAAIVGDKPLSRPQVVKALWVYIKERSLQDPKDRRIIRCDDKLKAVMKSDKINMMKMNQVLSKHLSPVGANELSGNVNGGEDDGEDDDEEEDGSGEAEEGEDGEADDHHMDEDAEEDDADNDNEA